MVYFQHGTHRQMPHHSEGLERRLKLLSLPQEILSLVAMALDFSGLARFRRTCRTLNRATQSRRVWQHVFERALGTTIPSPFFLAKPLLDCTAEDIECALRRWEMGWDPVEQIKPFRRTVDVTELGIRVAHMPSLDLLPGGRWCLAGYVDGSVWYFDLGKDSNATSDIKPRLLVPCPFNSPAEEVNCVQIRISIDYVSEEALGASPSSHHLRQFNIAVALCPQHRGGSPISTCINIWRVHIIEDTDTGCACLELGDHLSSFTEEATGRLLGCSLLGRSVAYAFGFKPARCTIIVDWEAANGMEKDQGFVRRYVPRIETPRIILLPGNRLLTVHLTDIVRIYDWLEDCPISTLQPSEQQLDLAPPRWVWQSLGIKGLAIGPPLLLRESLRLTLTTDIRTYGLTIPMAGTEATHVRPLLKGKFGDTRTVQAFGFHRGIGISDFEHLFTSQHRWKDGTASKAVRPRAFRSCKFQLHDMKRPGRLLFDQFSNRVLLTNDYTSCFYGLHHSTLGI